jgi:DNA polymerase elongation subunit (family B)
MIGWILDVCPDYERDEVAVWVKKEDGEVCRLTDSFTPSFYVSGSRDELNELVRGFAFSPSICGVSSERKQRTVSGSSPKNLLKIEVPRYSQLLRLAREINERGRFSRYTLYNADINLSLRYFFRKKISPMVLLSVKEKSGDLRYQMLEDPKGLHYEIPPLREARIQIRIEESGGVAKESDPLESIVLLSEGEELVLEGDEADVLTDLVKALSRLDPDIIYSDRRGSDELSYLYHRAGENELESKFQLGREASEIKKKDGKTYFTYGRVVYKPPSYSLKGRLYVDRSAFLYSESGVHGLIDLSRFSGISLQLLSRMSPGNAITTMQLRYAFENGILIPWKRQNPEYFKTAWKLLHSDRGGYIFDPNVGIYDNAAELDFASMYPNIMVKFNVSPETVLCRCCRDSVKRVPVLDYNICEKRTGLVPKVLKPVIERRFALKRLMKTAGRDMVRQYKERQEILKWLLITSFGYQGYRNARFGRIESHETICAYGRELLLRAKELAECFNFEVLHGLVDSLWVRREASVEDLERLCELISSDIGIDINLEGRYRWVVFLPNKSTYVGALNRYYGVFEDGTIKVRGIEMRMRNTPKLISSYQREVLDVLAQARGIEEFYGALGKSFRVLRKYAAALREQIVDPDDLIFTVGITKQLADYRVNNFSYAALRQLKQEGVELLPGQRVRYIVTNQKSRSYSEKVRIADAYEERDSYDSEFYIGHIIKATESLFLPFGYTVERLKQVLKGQKQTSLMEFANGWRIEYGIS